FQTQRQLYLTLRAQADRAGDRRVQPAKSASRCGCVVRFAGLNATEPPAIRRVGIGAGSAQGGWRIGEVGVVEQVVDLTAELQADFLADLSGQIRNRREWSQEDSADLGSTDWPCDASLLHLLVTERGILTLNVILYTT